MAFAKSNSDAFYVFNKYTKDITASRASGGRVEPSKYLLLNIPNINNSTIVEKLNDIDGSASSTQEFKEKFWNDFASEITISNTQYGDYINIQTYDENGQVSWNEVLCYVPAEVRAYSYNDVSINNIPTGEVTTHKSGDSYLINSVVVFYNVYDAANNKIQSDIPMGWFIPGNPIEKTIYSEDALGTGAALAIRLYTAYSTTPAAISVTSDSTTLGDVTSALSKLADVSQKMLEATSEIANKIQLEKELYNLLSNSRINVPYLVKVGTNYYWFVNGKNTGVSSSNNVISTGDIDNILNR